MGKANVGDYMDSEAMDLMREPAKKMREIIWFVIREGPLCLLYVATSSKTLQ